MLRTFANHLCRFRFASEVQKAPSGGKSAPPASGLTSYKDGQLITRTAITLKKQEDI